MSDKPLLPLKEYAAEIRVYLSAPSGALSISSFLKETGETVLRVFVRPEHRYLVARVPLTWKGVSVECDIAEVPVMSSCSVLVCDSETS
jgi:hypothetical protein